MIKRFISSKLGSLHQEGEEDSLHQEEKID